MQGLAAPFRKSQFTCRPVVHTYRIAAGRYIGSNGEEQLLASDVFPNNTLGIAIERL